MPTTVVRISPNTSNDQQPGNIGYDHLSEQTIPVDQVGPINVGGTLFIPMGPLLFNGWVTFFISTDNGATWTADGSGVKQACRNWACDWNPGTGLFTVAYLENTGLNTNIPIRVRQYNPSTQTWGANLTAGMSTAGVLTCRTRSNGDILVGHMVGGVGPQYFVSVFSGGAWTDVVLTAPIGNIITQAVLTGEVDSNDNLHLAAQYTDLVLSQYSYYRLRADNVLDPDGGLISLTPVNLGAGNLVVNSAGGYFALVYIDTSQPAGSQLTLTIGTGLGGAPVLSTVTIPDSGLDYLQTIAGNRFNGPVITQPADGNFYVTTFTQSTALGILFTSSQATPAGPYVQSQWIDEFDTNPFVILISDGLVALLPTGDPQFFFNAADGALGFSGRYTLGAQIAPLAITCDNPPDGTVGIAYTHTFPASGGTPPYTFSIIAGALPDGVTLDPATGIASGIPTLAGISPFMVQVQDSDPIAPAMAQVDCSITIAAPVVASTLKITFRGIKRRRCEAGELGYEELPEAPHVKRAV